jgi:DNA-binding NtrC family response regulator
MEGGPEVADAPAPDRILLVDDSPDALEVARRNLEERGFRVFTAGGVEEAVRVLEGTTIDLVVTDLKMPRIGGLDLVRHVRENFRETEVMVVTGYASVENAVEAVKTGAEEYLPKPFTDEELLAAVYRSLEKLCLRRAARPGGPADATAPAGFVGESASIREVYRAIRRAGAANATVLITGESGTGKELVARAIHYAGPRASAPFLPVNCGGIPDALIESELFGHVRGSFTGATESRAGFFLAAEGGTIFLDEVGDVSLAMQAKLLRALQEKEVCMVGATRPRKVDVRILAATNKDLPALVRRGAFREDLFFRLFVLSIAVPPLRERGDDVLLLARHFAARYAAEALRSPPRFTEEALALLRDHPWPGNVRELENLVNRLVLAAEGGAIDAPDLPEGMRFSALRERTFTRTLAEVEAEYVRNVLDTVGGNRTRAAAILGIDRKTLRGMLARSRPAAPPAAG